MQDLNFDIVLIIDVIDAGIKANRKKEETMKFAEKIRINPDRSKPGIFGPRI